MIAVIDYGRGNLGSVEKAFRRIGMPAVITQDPRSLDEADAVVLPGDGAFHDAMANLDRLGLVPAVRRALDGSRPFLGICLGYQLLFSTSEEFGEGRGLDVVPGAVRPTADVWIVYRSSLPLGASESKRRATCARPLTLADRFASVTTPPMRDPSASAVWPARITGRARCALTRSSTRLVSEPTGVSRITVSDVPAGIVISRAAGAGATAGAAPARPAVPTLPVAALAVSARLQPAAESVSARTPMIGLRMPSSPTLA